MNESEQVGMRLAHLLGHEQVFGIDSSIRRLQESFEAMSVREALVALNDPELMPLGRDLTRTSAPTRWPAGTSATSACSPISSP